MATVTTIYPIPGTRYVIVVMTDTVTILASANTAVFTFNFPNLMRLVTILGLNLLDVPFLAGDGIRSIGLSGNTQNAPVNASSQNIMVARQLAPATPISILVELVIIGELPL